MTDDDRVSLRDYVERLLAEHERGHDRDRKKAAELEAEVKVLRGRASTEEGERTGVRVSLWVLLTAAALSSSLTAVLTYFLAR